MSKDKIVNVRIGREQYEKIKELGYTFADCFEKGYEELLQNEKEKLAELDKKYYDLYIHVHTKLENFDKIKATKNIELEEMREVYFKATESHPHGRPLDKLEVGDISWIKGRIKKAKLREVSTVDQFINYCKGVAPKKEDLEVDEIKATKKTELEELRKNYLGEGRSLDKPLKKQDILWIEHRIGKIKGVSTVNQFINYCKKGINVL